MITTTLYTETAVYDKGRVRGIIGILSHECTRKFIPLVWYKGGGGGGEWMEPLSEVFDMLQYFETILPLVENLSSS